MAIQIKGEKVLIPPNLTGSTTAVRATSTARANPVTLGTGVPGSPTRATSTARANPPTINVSAAPYEIDGGPNYYSQFAPYTLPDDPAFFPVGVWLQYTGESTVASDQAMGINTYVTTFGSSQLAVIEAAGMYFILQGEGHDSYWLGDWHTSPAVVGWELSSQIDMIMYPADAYTFLAGMLAELPSDNRMRYNNYGKNLMFSNTDPEAAQFINNYQSVVSAVCYWFTDPNIHSAVEGGKLLNGSVDMTYDQTRRASNYGYTVDRVRALDAMTGGRKPVWGFVEVGWPWTETLAQGARLILPAEMKAAVWHSIIAGARGITYYAHSLAGADYPTNAVLHDSNYTAMQTAVTEVNALIHSLAPVLNSQFDPGFASASASVRVMCKNFNGQRYLFAGSKENVSSTGTFTLNGITTGTAAVVDEDRAIPIIGGQFSDAFANGNAIHIYNAAPTVEIDGGTNYFSQFAYPFPDDPAFFPVGVWLQYAGESVNDSYKAMGINTYVCTFSSSDLASLEADDMYVILQGTIYNEFWTDEIANPAVVGWEMHDEVDMSMTVADGFAHLDAVEASLPNDGRMRFNNYGKGVLFWHSDADSAQYINDYQAVTSADMYWFTDAHCYSQYEGGKVLNGGVDMTYDQTRRASNYGWTVDRIRALDAMSGARKPIWGFVEVGWPSSETLEQGARAITPAEMRAAVWHSIIAGARGMTYFAHSFGGPFPGNAVLTDTTNYAVMIAAVTEVNTLIHSLATVLNSPFEPSFASASASVRVMCKNFNGQRYLFAGSKENVSSTGTFTLSSVVTGTATVISESRTIPITGGQFSDAFADGNAIHIYRID